MQIESDKSRVLSCIELQFGYERALCAPLTWTVNPGEIWAIAGSNGCGKTTLMRTLLGFLRPISGTFYASSNRSYLAQNAEGPHLCPGRVRDVVSLGLEHGLTCFIPLYAYRHRSQVDEVIAAFELDALAHRSIHQLSPGERQRVFMAQAIVRRPSLLFLDEAASAMDPVHAKSSFALLAQRAAASDCAVIAISHSLYAQMDAFTHILAFCGREIAMGKKENVIGKLPEAFHV